MSKSKMVVAFVLSVIMLTSPLGLISSVNAESLEEQLAAIEQELEYIRGLQNQLEDDILNQAQLQNRYYGEIGKLRAEKEELQLKLTELDLQIKELELSIEQLEELIVTKEAELAENEALLLEMETQTDKRINEGYMDFRTHRQNRVDIFNVSDPNTYFKDSQYREIIQAKSNKIIEELAELKIQLNRDREDLREKQVQVKRDRATVEEKQTQLQKAEADLKKKIESYDDAIYQAQVNISNSQYNLEVYSDQESKRMAEAERIRQELFNQVNSIPNGKYVVAGTQIGNQGSTGWSTGPHLHFIVKKNGSYKNPCKFLTYKVSSSTEGSCGWGSGLQWPLSGNFYYTSRYYGGGSDSRCFGGSCHSHPAIDIAHTIWNAPVYAAHDGWLYKGVDQYGALYIIICQDKNNCSNGLQTGYWHLSAY